MVFFTHKPAAAETVFTLETVGAVIYELALNDVIRKTYVITLVLNQSRQIYNFRAHGGKTIKIVSDVQTGADQVNAIFGIIRHEKAVLTVFTLVKIVARNIFALLGKERPVPGSLGKHFFKFFFC